MASHYLNQWWLVSWSTHICVTRPQWVNAKNNPCLPQFSRQDPEILKSFCPSVPSLNSKLVQHYFTTSIFKTPKPHCPKFIASHDSIFKILSIKPDECANCQMSPFRSLSRTLRWKVNQQMTTSWIFSEISLISLNQWSRVAHLCISKLNIIDSDNAGILLIGNLGTNLSEILSKIHAFSFKKMHLKILSVKRRQFRSNLNELKITSIA